MYMYIHVKSSLVHFMFISQLIRRALVRVQLIHVLVLVRVLYLCTGTPHRHVHVHLTCTYTWAPTNRQGHMTSYLSNQTRCDYLRDDLFACCYRKDGLTVCNECVISHRASCTVLVPYFQAVHMHLGDLINSLTLSTGLHGRTCTFTCTCMVHECHKHVPVYMYMYFDMLFCELA